MSPAGATEGRSDRGRLEITADDVVIAEGKDETDLSRHLLRPRRDRVQIVNARGQGNVAALIRLVARDRRFRSSGRSLGVVVDADDHPGRIFDLVAQTLESADLPRPAEPEVLAGFPDGRVHTGVFVAPGQGRTGTVEDLYLPVVDPARRRLADSYLATVSGAGLPKLKTPGKAVLQSVLAALPRSPRQPGDGLQHGLVHDDAALEPLRRFLLRLTDGPGTGTSEG